MKHFSHGLRTLASTVSAAAILSCMGQDVSYNQALKIAGDFFQDHGVTSAPSVMHRANAADAPKGVNSAYYIINTDGAFAVVSGDSRIGPVLAYSLDEAFDPDNIAPGAAYMLDLYESYIMALANGEVQPPKQSRISIAQGKELTTATWDQSPSPWNDACPKIDGTPTYGGCAATAMSIIMRYHEYPASGYGRKKYTSVDPVTHDEVGELSVDFDTDYNLSTIPLAGWTAATWTTEQQAAVAKIIYHAGVAASMMYGTGASGTTNACALVGMSQYFGYTMGCIVGKSKFDDIDDYLQLIIDEIDAGYPMLYSGDSTADRGGHMFVCDGYDTDARLHFNYGWSGAGNAYYYITPEPSGVTEFSNYQNVVIGIHPDHGRTGDAPALSLMTASNSCPYSINLETIHKSEYFDLTVTDIYNTADKDVRIRLAVKLCSADGSVKATLREMTGDALIKSGNYAANIFADLSLPLDYNYAEGDKICIYYSLDSGTTWQPVTGYFEENSAIDLAGLYDDSIVLNMNMIKPFGGECKGMTPQDGSNITNDGSDFSICLNYLCNNSGLAFTGDVAIYLCDENGAQKLQIGKNEGFTLNSNYYTSTTYVTCRIPAGTTLNSGDRLIAYCRYTGEEEWFKVGCTEESLGYILIPDALCSHLPTSVNVTFTNLMTTYSPYYDLDFSTVDDFYAFKLVQQDRETLILERIYELKAGEGALLWGKNLTEGTYTEDVAVKEGAASHDDNLLVGVLVDTTVDNSDSTVTKYVFRSTAQESGFYQANGETVSAGQAYMCISGSPMHAPARFALFVSPDTSGNVGIACDGPADNVIYNMQGIRVTNPTSGIYIINGKKVIIRM